ncbi:MAG TPA: DsbA family protein [Burkholderiaceae bacterium]|nr:DsbA family protein [Burkholderiaceae bacterium]
MPSLIYIADPMCSWCYGFGPELATLLQGLPELPLEIMVGGLRIHNPKAMDEASRATLLSHWKQVEQASGRPFVHGALASPDFVYDTEPACRALVAARMLAPAASLYVFHAIQHAFYATGWDVTQGDVLAQVASTALAETGFTIEPAAFRAKWTAPETIAATAEDFDQVRRWGISGFPALLLERDGNLDLVTSGYMNIEGLVANMQAIIDQDA